MASNILFSAVLVATLGTGVVAQAQSSNSMPGMTMQDSQKMSNMQSPVQKEFMAASDKMNKGMMDGMMDPDPGKSWMKQMAAHHQGAIDMSDVVLKNTKDAEVLKEARKTKEDNEKALKELQAKMKK